MKELVIKYFREIIIVVFAVIISFFLYKIYGTSNDNSELIKYKLEVLDKEIDQLYNQRKSLDSSINLHNKNIQKIDYAINNLKVEKTTVNKYYQVIENEIRQADAKKVDSLLRLRYRY
jgi:septal ring factor EnvC (AmiA/AmiB activator)